MSARKRKSRLNQRPLIMPQPQSLPSRPPRLSTLQQLLRILLIDLPLLLIRLHPRIRLLLILDLLLVFLSLEELVLLPSAHKHPYSQHRFHNPPILQQQ